MKRKILFTILCIGVLSIGAIAYTGLVQADGTSMLSDRNMAQITGTCSTCYDDGWDTDCRWHGDLDCSTGSCDEEAYRMSGAYAYQVTTSGSPNGKEPDYNWVPCYTRYSVQEDYEHHPYFCNTATPGDWDPEEYNGYWYSCKWAISEWCQECSWDTQLESSYMIKSWFCEDV